MILFGLRFVVLNNGLDDEELALISEQIVNHGGELLGNIYSSGIGCSHLLTVEGEGEEVEQASKDGVQVVSEHWLEACVRHGRLHLRSIASASNLLLCLTGYPASLRQCLQEMVTAAGAKYTGKLTKAVTHLIAYEFSGAKWEFARKQPNMAIVNHGWLQDSLQDWEIKPVEPYTHRCGKDVEAEEEAEAAKQEDNCPIEKSNQDGNMAHTDIANNLAEMEQEMLSESFVSHQAGKRIMIESHSAGLLSPPTIQPVQVATPSPEATSALNNPHPPNAASKIATEDVSDAPLDARQGIGLPDDPGPEMGHQKDTSGGQEFIVCQRSKMDPAWKAGSHKEAPSPFVGICAQSPSEVERVFGGPATFKYESQRFCTSSSHIPRSESEFTQAILSGRLRTPLSTDVLETKLNLNFQVLPCAPKPGEVPPGVQVRRVPGSGGSSSSVGQGVVLVARAGEAEDRLKAWTLLASQLYKAQARNLMHDSVHLRLQLEESKGYACGDVLLETFCRAYLPFALNIHELKPSILTKQGKLKSLKTIVDVPNRQTHLPGKEIEMVSVQRSLSSMVQELRELLLGPSLPTPTPHVSDEARPSFPFGSPVHPPHFTPASHKTALEENHPSAHNRSFSFPTNQAELIPEADELGNQRMDSCDIFAQYQLNTEGDNPTDGKSTLAEPQTLDSDRGVSMEGSGGTIYDASTQMETNTPCEKLQEKGTRDVEISDELDAPTQFELEHSISIYDASTQYDGTENMSSLPNHGCSENARGTKRKPVVTVVPSWEGDEQVNLSALHVEDDSPNVPHSHEQSTNVKGIDARAHPMQSEGIDKVATMGSPDTRLIQEGRKLKCQLDDSPVKDLSEMEREQHSIQQPKEMETRASTRCALSDKTNNPVKLSTADLKASVRSLTGDSQASLQYLTGEEDLFGNDFSEYDELTQIENEDDEMQAASPPKEVDGNDAIQQFPKKLPTVAALEMPQATSDTSVTAAIEQILAERTKGKGKNQQTEFLVKWKNVPEDEATWETEECILPTAEAILKEFKLQRRKCLDAYSRHKPVEQVASSLHYRIMKDGVAPNSSHARRKTPTVLGAKSVLQHQPVSNTVSLPKNLNVQDAEMPESRSNLNIQGMEPDPVPKQHERSNSVAHVKDSAASSDRSSGFKNSGADSHEDKIVSLRGKAKPVRCTARAKKTKTITFANVPYVAVSGMHEAEQQWAAEVVRSLGGRLLRGHIWDARTTHVIFGSSGSRGEKFLAGVASGAHLLGKSFLEASKEAGTWVSERPHLWAGGRGVGAGLIQPTAIEYWHTWHHGSAAPQGQRGGMFSQLRVALYGEFDTKAVLTRVVPAGGGQVVCQAPPYTKAIQEGLSCAIVQPDKAPSNKWIKAFASAAVPCVSPEMFLDLLARPSEDLKPHLLFGSLSFGPSLAKTIRQICPQDTCPQSSASAQLETAPGEVHSASTDKADTPKEGRAEVPEEGTDPSQASLKDVDTSVANGRRIESGKDKLLVRRNRNKPLAEAAMPKSVKTGSEDTDVRPTEQEAGCATFIGQGISRKRRIPSGSANYSWLCTAEAETIASHSVFGRKAAKSRK